MGKNAKLGIGALLVVLLAIVAYSQLGAMLGIAVLVLGGLGIAVLFQRLPDDEGGGGGDGAPKKKGKELTGKKRLDALLDSQAEGGTTTTKPRPAATPPAGEGLPTWGGGLDTWTPPAGDDTADVATDEPATSDWDSWDNNWSGDDSDTISLDTEHPLDGLEDLDAEPVVEPLAVDEDSISFDEFEDEWAGTDTADEVEIDVVEVEVDTEDAGAGSGFSFTAAPPVINEDVSTADDIMAASHATELDDEVADDSELAKLLAKVQARLAAYE